MAVDRQALLARLRESFKAEAHERLAVIREELKAWQKNDCTTTSIDTVFREVHSLKGAARAAGLTNVEKLCHDWEHLLAQARNQPQLLDEEQRDWSKKRLQSVEAACRELNLNEQDSAATNERKTVQAERTPAQQDPQRVRVQQQQLATLLNVGDELKQVHHGLHGIYVGQHERLRDSSARMHRLNQLDTLLQQQQEFIAKVPAQQQYVVREVNAMADFAQMQLRQMLHEQTSMQRQLEHYTQQLKRTIEHLQGQLQTILLQPAEHLFEGMEAMVEELATNAGKRTQLKWHIDDIHIDKRMIDELRPVITHLLRNAVDHGIRTTGTITVSLQQHDAGRFSITIADDGNGLDLEALYQAAKAKNLVDRPREELSERDLQLLIFATGLSTRKMITEVSGRGIGMSVVQDVLERLGGKLHVSSAAQRGTEFKMSLPTSFSSFRAVLVREHEQTFALPALSVVRCIRIEAANVRTVKGYRTLRIDERQLPLVRLASLLKSSTSGTDENPVRWAILIEVHQELLALEVDALIDDLEVTVSPLGPELAEQTLYMGVAEGDPGQLVPILNPNELLRTARLASRNKQPKPTEQTQSNTAHLLVVDDSFTSRGLLKSIIEAAGYRVTTANDGAEAWRKLKQDEFDLLVSDIEMPTMDGFLLTEKVRSDRQLQDLPIILVTALQSPEDQTRGLEAGANAYLVKSSFEQDSLLDAISRLL
ncbi:hybrid sensor histidine kinase/response regulator [Pseudidiomarina homiensis]|uniref:hybrid sensor histidine kinase/response regulator n=1 Tax=Pseudidiomarina homiensis TaxID=364198 RepID=UPI00215A37D0|nr:response regulator [Pseudidiomarina homiensis]